MEILRTANAGVLLTLDGVSILLDGICKELFPYFGTPKDIRKELTLNFPDILAFTHYHDDHYDEEYENLYKTNTIRPVFGPDCDCFGEYKGIEIKKIPTRHIGKTEIEHVSFIIKGSKCVYFMGDSSPLEWKAKSDLPKPDVVIAPYAYAVTESAWRITKELGADDIILLHLPDRKNDEYKLWDMVEKTVGNDESLHIIEVGKEIKIM